MTNEHEPYNYPRAVSLAPHSDESILRAIKWLAENSKDEDDLLVVRPTKNDHMLNSFPSFKRFLSFRGVHDASIRTAPAWFTGGVLLLMPDDQLISKYSGSPQTSSLCVVENSRNSAQPWIDAFRPQVLNGTLEFAEIDLDDVAREALRGLTDVTNNGFVTPDDRDDAINTITSLQRHGHMLKETDVRAFLLSLMWEGSAVEEFMAILRKIQSGIRMKTSHKSDHYAVWERRAGERR